MRGRGVPKQNLNIQESDSINLLPESTSSDIHEAMSSSSEIVPIETDEVHMDPGTSLPTNPDVSQIPLIDPDLPTGFSSAKRPLDEAEESRDPAEGMAKRRRSSRTKVEEETDASSDFEKVRLICRPWRKPEGHLNRSSFSSMLESVLLFVMANPSCIRKAIEDKFGPYLKPVALLELLEVLQDLGCVTKNILRKTSSKTSLFSKPTTYQNVEIEKEGDIVMYESTPDCCLKFGQFSFFLSALN
ncbi:hypothetical protein SNE40_015192 [Patella caerulea]|uniref:Uncharacterized protein n=1 Tax=Patella caerulea TaxID=87958 RepID=A0AAN8PEA5_PATCE